MPARCGRKGGSSMKKFLCLILAALCGIAPAHALTVDNGASLPSLILGGDLPFGDVAESDWFFDGVDYVYRNGLMSGVAADTFAPDTTLTRSMLICVLWRRAGSPAADGASFADVAPDSWYAAAVNWGVANKIVSGVAEDTFAPDALLSREQLAVMLANYAAAFGTPLTAADLGTFADSGDVSDWAQGALAKMVGSGILSGSDNMLLPKKSASRAEAAAILARFFKI